MDQKTKDIAALISIVMLFACLLFLIIWHAVENQALDAVDHTMITVIIGMLAALLGIQIPGAMSKNGKDKDK